MNGSARLLTVLAAICALALAGAGVEAAHAADVTAKISKQRLRVESKAGNAKITLRLRAGHPQQLVVDSDSDGDADFVFDRRKFKTIVIDGRRGNDTIRIGERYGVFTNKEKTALLGGRGTDTLVGGSGSETLAGGPGADTIRGGHGSDVVSLGPDDDVFEWFAGDGSDAVEGQDGLDTVRVGGSASGESYGVTANGTRVRVTRSGRRVIDAGATEHLDLHPLGGGDTVTVADLTGTPVTKLDVAFGPSAGVANQLVVNATQGDDTTTLTSSSGAVTIGGLAAQIVLITSAVTNILRVNVLAGDDVIEASGVVAGLLSLTEDGGAGDDVLIGSAGPDIVFGGDGDDVLIGGPGTDVLDGGAGNDTIIQD